MIMSGGVRGKLLESATEISMYVGNAFYCRTGKYLLNEPISSKASNAPRTPNLLLVNTVGRNKDGSLVRDNFCPRSLCGYM